MVGRSRLFKWVTAIAVPFLLSTGITVAVIRTLEDDVPTEWDARVLDLVHFVERERGALYDHPVPVEFLTPEEYSEQTRTDEGLLTEEERAEFEQFEGMMRALGIVPGDVDLLEAGNDLSDSGTLAYYDSLEERVVVRGTEVNPGLAVTLVHELTHVLQDQVFGLDRLEEEDDEATSGESFAFRALVEGDADRIEQKYLDTLDEATRAAIDAENAVGLDDFEATGVPVALTSLIGSTYELGDAFIAVLEATAKVSVDAAFNDPPISEEEIFDPFAYFGVEVLSVVDPPETDGAEVFDEGDFGAVSLLVVLAERIDPRAALAAATGWGGDAYAVFSRDDRTCIRLNVTGDTPGDTSELADAVAGWVEAAPNGAAASMLYEGDVVRLESCDPGASSAGGSGGSVDAVGLAAARNHIAASALQEGADNDVARCFGSAVVDGLTNDELAVEEASPALVGRVADIAADCRERS